MFQTFRNAWKIPELKNRLPAETGSLAIAGANAAALTGHSLVCAGNRVQFMKFHYAYTPCY